MKSDIIKETIRNLRKNQTNEEKKLWELIRNRKILSTKFLRQYPIEFIYDNKKYFFVADFYSAKSKPVIEIDGNIHLNNRDKDIFRDGLLLELGYKILRFKNNDINSNIDYVIKRIKENLPLLLSSRSKFLRIRARCCMTSSVKPREGAV